MPLLTIIPQNDNLFLGVLIYLAFTTNSVLSIIVGTSVWVQLLSHCTAKPKRKNSTVLWQVCGRLQLSLCGFRWPLSPLPNLFKVTYWSLLCKTTSPHLSVALTWLSNSPHACWTNRSVLEHRVPAIHRSKTLNFNLLSAHSWEIWMQSTFADYSLDLVHRHNLVTKRKI